MRSSQDGTGAFFCSVLLVSRFTHSSPNSTHHHDKKKLEFHTHDLPEPHQKTKPLNQKVISHHWRPCKPYDQKENHLRENTIPHSPRQNPDDTHQCAC